MKEKIALITGIAGQDGSYLTEFLLKKGYEIHGIIRKKSPERLKNLSNDIIEKITLHEGDIIDSGFVNKTITNVNPAEIYHLAAQSHVGYSFQNPSYTIETNIKGTTNILESARYLCYDTKIYFAGSSEQFGKVLQTPQTELTPFNPRSPYGISKVAGFYLSVNYRESYNMFISCGLSFNHESMRRGEEFVTKKIAQGVARIANTKRKYPISLGNIDTKRDWGYAPDYVEAMWLMLQQKKPDNYVIATSETHSVKEFIIEAFRVAGIDIYPNNNAWQYYISESTVEHMRPTEVHKLSGDYSKAKKELGWEPKVKFKELVKIMVEYELNNTH